MIDLNKVLEQARRLSPEDQVKLIEAWWESAPPDTELLLHPEWNSELQRRMEALKKGDAATVAWTNIRAEAMARLGHAPRT